MRQASPIAVASGLHWGKCGEVLVFLDERRGRYSALAPESAVLWEDLFGSSSAHNGGASGRAASRLSADERDLLREAWDLGWLVEGEPAQPSYPPARSPRRHFLLMHAFRLLASMHRLVGRGGLGQAYSAARRSARETRLPDRGAALPLDDLLRRFRQADRWVSSSLGAEDCLPRSLALFAFLRSSGLAASHHVGVAQHPFRAHAWVEFNGTALLEREGRTDAFVEIARLI